MTRRAFSVLPWALATMVASAQPLPAPKSGLTLERLMSFPQVAGRSPSSVAMSPDGQRVVFSWNRTGERMMDVWMMDFPNGQPTEV